MPPNTSYKPPKQPLNAPPIAQKALTLSRKVDKCKPLPWAPPPTPGSPSSPASAAPSPPTRGLHSSTSQLNLSRF